MFAHSEWMIKVLGLCMPRLRHVLEPNLWQGSTALVLNWLPTNGDCGDKVDLCAKSGMLLGWYSCRDLCCKVLEVFTLWKPENWDYTASIRSSVSDKYFFFCTSSTAWQPQGSFMREACKEQSKENENVKWRASTKERRLWQAMRLTNW